MRPTENFLRQLKSIDPYLRVRWHGGRERWLLMRMNAAPGKNGLCEDAPKRIATPEAVYNGTAIYKSRESGTFICWIETADGGFAPLGDHVIRMLRQADTWKRGLSSLKLKEAQEERDRRAAAADFNDEIGQITKTVCGMNNPKLDLGGNVTSVKGIGVRDTV